MIELEESSKVFVLSPKDHVTGGTELLHQLVHVLNVKSINAYIVYYDLSFEICKADIPDAFKDYSIKVSNNVQDLSNNTIVLNEVSFNKVTEYKNLQVVFWWLSVDFFFYASQDILNILDLFRWNPRFTISIFHSRLKGWKNPFISKLSIKELCKLNVLNCYQSEYAHNFLISKGFRKVLPLTDYINGLYITSSFGKKENEKKNIILYNPQKGYRFTQKLIKSSPHLTWVPLQNMTREQVKEFLQISKLYVDFGEHPGKDRMPREAAMSGCCIVTGTFGSSKFFEDISIDDCYKIDQRNTNIASIISLLEDILNNYKMHNKNFTFYRNRIRQEKLKFEEQVLQIFAVKS